MQRRKRVSVPSRGEVDDMHKGLDVSIYAKPELFPSPTEVDRYLYGYLIALALRLRNFRPLSR